MGLLNYLPEDPNEKAAARQGLLQFGASMLGGTGNFGQILGSGLMQGAQGYHGALAQQQQAALRAAQAKQVGLENTKLEREAGAPDRFARILGGNASPTAGLPKIGGAPSAPAQTAAPAQASSAPVSLFDQYRAMGDRLSAAGELDEANKYYKVAEGYKPKLKEQQARTVNGQRVLANVYDDGRTEQVEGFTPDLEKLSFQDTGGATVGLDPFSGKPVNTIKKTVSPDTMVRDATDRRGQNMVDARAKATAAATAAAAGSAEGLLDDETVKIMAEQYLAGDTSVMQNLGRGAQGAKNIIKIRKEITSQTKAEGKGGRDLAAQNAEYFGTKAGQRSAGTRIANVEMAVFEAQNLMPLARESSAAVARAGLLPFGKAQVMFNEQTNDPAMRQFAAANNALVNVYSRAISPTGVPTVSDKEHAREMISTAMNHEAYTAVIDQMEKELKAAQAAPQQVRKAFNDAVTRKGGHGAKDLPQKQAGIPSGWTVRER